MSEMIERVATVLKTKIGEAFDATPIPGSPPEWSDWSATDGTLDLEKLARDVIAAMREPTDGMCEASAAYYHDNYQVGHAKEQTTAPLIWQAMIDAALKTETA